MSSHVAKLKKQIVQQQKKINQLKAQIEQQQLRSNASWFPAFRCPSWHPCIFVNREI